MGGVGGGIGSNSARGGNFGNFEAISSTVLTCCSTFVSTADVVAPEDEEAEDDEVLVRPGTLRTGSNATGNTCVFWPGNSPVGYDATGVHRTGLLIPQRVSDSEIAEAHEATEAAPSAKRAAD